MEDTGLARTFGGDPGIALGSLQGTFYNGLVQNYYFNPIWNFIKDNFMVGGASRIVVESLEYPQELYNKMFNHDLYHNLNSLYHFGNNLYHAGNSIWNTLSMIFQILTFPINHFLNSGPMFTAIINLMNYVENRNDDVRLLGDEIS